MIDVDRLPPEIRQTDRAVLWNYEQRNGKQTKVPYVPHRPTERAAVDDPATWGSLTEALAAVEDGKADGLGIVLGDGLIGIDRDGCRDPETGEIDSDARAIVEQLASYAEISPSGRGLHVLVRGSLPPGGRRKGKIEMYADGRYFTLTGQHIDGTPTTIAERTGQLAALHARVFGGTGNGNGHGRASAPRPSPPLDLDDQTLLEKATTARNGAKFAALWAGDVSGYGSPSEADLALCDLLSFWTGADAGRMDRLFRRAGLMRPKWDERRGTTTYGEATIAKALDGCVETYTGPQPARSTSDPSDAPDEPSTSEDPCVTPAPYAFAPAVDEDHFLSQWITYASGRTDAAHEYHEATGLALLAAATPTVRARLAPYPNGLPTNLYALLIGDSTTSRKSTSKDLGRDVQDRALPGSLSADHFSPEGFVEQLASRPHDSTTLYVDEFGETLDKLHHAKHMAGLRGLLMTVYAGDAYTYRRHSKRSRDGARIADEDRIDGPHLSILGATTPAIFDVLAEPDVISGLLPRFAVIMPTAKPARRPFFEVGGETEGQRSALVTWLHRLHVWATSTPRIVRFAPGVLDQLDAFAATLERTAGTRTETAKAMGQRLPAMAVKLAMLLAAGQPDTPNRPSLEITPADAASAIQIARRWQTYALTFADRIGESDFERKLQRCLRLVLKRRRVSRSVIARQAKVDRKTLDNIRDTLVDRAAVTVQHVKADAGPAAEFWVAHTDGEELL